MSDVFPNDVLYRAEHGWARPDGGAAALGITSLATDPLGEIVHFELPEVGQEISKDAAEYPWILIRLSAQLTTTEGQ